MKKVWFACDSFKGSLSSQEIAEILSDETKACFPHLETHCLFISDGGEGLIDAVVQLPGFKRVISPSVDGWLRPIQTSYARKDTTAIIEMAQCSGLSVCHPLDPSMTSTYGTGLQIKQAIEQGCKTIYIGLGGSGTHDGATGIATALNAHFYNQQKEEFCPTGATLCAISQIDCRDLKASLAGCQVYLLSDVQNPAYGANGAACVFALQKGATKAMIHHLESNTIHYCNQLTKTMKTDFSRMPGAGAAGACGVGLLSLLDAQCLQGLDCLLQWANFDECVKDANLIVTGEGKLDNQSLNGKVVYGLLKVGQRHHIPVVSICGRLDLPYSTLKEHGFYDVLVINPKTMPLQECMAKAKSQLRSSWHDWIIENGKVLFQDDACYSYQEPNMVQ